jgi:hypothetical protein
LLARTTRILVTHQLNFAKLADLLVVIDRGAIVAQGRYNDLAHAGGATSGVGGTLAALMAGWTSSSDGTDGSSSGSSGSSHLSPSSAAVVEASQTLVSPGAVQAAYANGAVLGLPTSSADTREAKRRASIAENEAGLRRFAERRASLLARAGLQLIESTPADGNADQFTGVTTAVPMEDDTASVHDSGNEQLLRESAPEIEIDDEPITSNGVDTIGVGAGGDASVETNTQAARSGSAAGFGSAAAPTNMDTNEEEATNLSQAVGMRTYQIFLDFWKATSGMRDVVYLSVLIIGGSLAFVAANGYLGTWSRMTYDSQRSPVSIATYLVLILIAIGLAIWRTVAFTNRTIAASGRYDSVSLATRKKYVFIPQIA